METRKFIWISNSYSNVPGF